MLNVLLLTLFHIKWLPETSENNDDKICVTVAGQESCGPSNQNTEMTVEPRGLAELGNNPFNMAQLF